VKLAGFLIVDGDDQASATLERDFDDNESAFFDSLHGSISGSGLHCGHNRTLLKDLL
jgi:hypothetical protein